MEAIQIKGTTCTNPDHRYCIFPLLSTCAYISTERKPAPNSEMRLTKNSYIQKRMRVCGIVYGCGQSIDRMIIRVVAFRPARNGAHSSKNLPENR